MYPQATLESIDCFASMLTSLETRLAHIFHRSAPEREIINGYEFITYNHTNLPPDLEKIQIKFLHQFQLTPQGHSSIIQRYHLRTYTDQINFDISQLAVFSMVKREGKTVGTAEARYETVPGDVSLGILIDPTAQHCCLGKKLFALVYEECVNQNLRNLHVDIDASNHPMSQLMREAYWAICAAPLRIDQEENQVELPITSDGVHYLEEFLSQPRAQGESK